VSLLVKTKRMGDELGGFPPAYSWHALNGMETSNE
jgi:hypothetical protein